MVIFERWSISEIETTSHSMFEMMLPLWFGDAEDFEMMVVLKSLARVTALESKTYAPAFAIFVIMSILAFFIFLKFRNLGSPENTPE